MAVSSAVAPGQSATAAQYNNLRTDALGAQNLWVPVTYGRTNELNDIITPYGDFPAVACIALNDYGLMSFKVPHDFVAITSAEIIVIPQATEANADWDISSDYGAVGEAYNTHSEADAASTYNVVSNQLFAVDVSGILTALAADDYVGIKLLQANDDIANDVYILGLRFRYA